MRKQGERVGDSGEERGGVVGKKGEIIARLNAITKANLAKFHVKRKRVMDGTHLSSFLSGNQGDLGC